MDAFIVSAYVRNSLQSKKQKRLEHAAFIVNQPSSSENYNLTNRSNNMKSIDKSDNSSTVVDNSDNSTIADNSDNYKTVDNSDNSATAVSNTDNSNNITVNNIKLTAKGGKIINQMEDEEDEEEEYQNNNKASKISNITFILMLIINSYAAYLSWECNSNKGYPLVLKVVFSFFAFVFGSIYLLYYILFRFDECNQFKHRSLI